MIKNIVFDCNEILIQWDVFEIYKGVFKSEVESIFFFTHVCTKSWNRRQDAGRSFEEGTFDLQTTFPKYRKEIAMFYDKWQDMVKDANKENVKLLSTLKSDYRLYCLTNCSAESFPVLYDKYSFLKLFEGIVVSGEERMLKPNPDIYEVLLTRYGILAGETLFIDADKDNIDTARVMGLETIQYSDSANLIKQLKEKKIVE